MKKSLRWKLFLQMSYLIVIFVLLSWIFNTQFLDRFYVSEKKKELIESFNVLNEAYQGDLEDISLQIEKLERMSGLNITILDSNYRPIYRSYAPNRDRMNAEIENPRFTIPSPNMGPPGERRAPGGDNWVERMGTYVQTHLKDRTYVIETVQDFRLNTEFLNLFARLRNGDYLLINTPLAAMSESADIANTFFLLIGLITIAIGSVAIYFLADKFTRPIQELNVIAQRMSHLDFGTKYVVKTDDEIGELGQSINSLSDQLDRSITELREANRKLQQDIERERRIDEMRKEFISNVSHELKTPIALIQGYAEGLRLNVNEDEANKDFYCEVIMDEASKMDKLVRQLLDLSMIESGYFHIERSDFDLSYLIRQVIFKYDPIFKEKNIQVKAEFEDGVKANGDPVRIEQVLFNYLDNAINHVDHRRLIKIGLNKVGDKIRVTVFNSGKPIPEAALEDIWMSFYKVDKARTRAYGGTGLGLSIVRAIQELHQCGFGVSNMDGGVEFWFDIDPVPAG